MSLPLPGPSSMPEETARLARTICPQGTLYMQIRDQLGVIYENRAFADLFSTRGQPAEAPWRLMLVCIFQFIEGLTDRQAAEAVQQRIDWKYALALELSDPGFDFSVLSKFRARLVAGGAEIQLFEAMLECLKTRGLLKINTRTAQRWRKLPAFEEAYQKGLDVRFEQALSILKAGVRTALNTLARNMSERTPPNVQVSAARIWLESAIEVHKLNQLEQQLREFELMSHYPDYMPYGFNDNAGGQQEEQEHYAGQD